MDYIPKTSAQIFDYTTTLIKKTPSISFLRIKWSFMCKNLCPLHPRMLFAKFGWNWSNGSREDDFKTSSM